MRVDVYEDEIIPTRLVQRGSDIADVLPEPDERDEALADLLATGIAAVGGGSQPLFFLVAAAPA
ncbi:hypothetical protein [Inquilinus sp. CA228]|uniref:hypothetical protein n=1 Tax=Inquilinus sp. CA228 TaxID=3455609 RepID=UPI003F8D7BA1